MRKKNGNSAIFLLLLVIISAGGVFFLRSQQGVSQKGQESKAPAAFIPQMIARDTDVHNPDGTMKLVMHIERQMDGSTIYTFFITDISGENKKLIFTKTEPKENSMTLHHNSFSPDNKLVIIEEHAGDGVSYLVLKVSGEPFANGSQFLNIVDLYKERKIQYQFSDVTGWAGPTLAIVRTKKDDGSKGPSFWFVTDSRAFLQLIR